MPRFKVKEIMNDICTECDIKLNPHPANAYYYEDGGYKHDGCYYCPYRNYSSVYSKEIVTPLSVRTDKHQHMSLLKTNVGDTHKSLTTDLYNKKQ